jgi:uncharacterized membrane protein HdeD (DUF308 family)
VTDPAVDRSVLAAMIRNWWMMAARGGLAVLFGLSVLWWPDVTLPTIVVLFGVYALVDGMLAIAAATHGRLRLLEAWPVALEGVVSVVLGIVALGWPLRVPRDFLFALVTWGIATGILEIAQAVRLPRTRAAHWLLGTGGVSSLFLAVLLLMLPYAGVDRIVHVIGAYALVFGTVVTLAAFVVSRDGRPWRARSGR